MEKLKTNELSLGLNQTFRSDLVDNFEKIQKGVDSQSDALNKQITDLLGDVAPQDQNEVTQARIDVHGSYYGTLKSREDVTQTTAETALSEERATSVEVQDARTNSNSQTYPTLKERMDNQENDLTNSMNAKISQISSVPEAFANLAALQSAYPNGKAGLFVTADTGHKFIWANGSWTDAGIYQSVGIPSLSSIKDLGDLNYLPVVGINAIRDADKPIIFTATGKAEEVSITSFSGGNTATDRYLVDDTNIFGKKVIMEVTYTIDKPLKDAGYLQISQFGNPDWSDYLSLYSDKFAGTYTVKQVVTLPTLVKAVDPTDPTSIPAFQGRSVNYTGTVTITNFRISYCDPGKPETKPISQMTASEAIQQGFVGMQNQLDHLDLDDIKDQDALSTITAPNISAIDKGDKAIVFHGTGLLSENSIANFNGTADDVNQYRVANTNLFGQRVHMRITYTLDQPLGAAGLINMQLIGNPDWSSYLMISGTHTGGSYTIEGTYNLPALTNNDFVLFQALANNYTGNIRITNFNIWVDELPKQDTLSNMSAGERIATAFRSTMQLDNITNRKQLDNVQIVGANLDTNSHQDWVEEQFSGWQGMNFHSFTKLKPDTNYTLLSTLMTDNGDHKWSCEVYAIDRDGNGTMIGVTGAHVVANNPQAQVYCNFNTADYVEIRCYPYIADSAMPVTTIRYKEEMLLEGTYDSAVYRPPYYQYTNTPAALSDMFMKLQDQIAVLNERYVNLPIINLGGNANQAVGIDKPMTVPYVFIDSHRKQTGYATISWQGDSSKFFAKKSFKFKTFTDTSGKQKQKWKPAPTFYKSHNFNLKSYWNERYTFRDSASAAIQANFVMNNPTAPKELLAANNFGSIQSYPVLLYVNGQFYGLMELNTKSSSDLWNIDDSNPNQIAMEANGKANKTGALWKQEQISVGDNGDFALNSNNNTNAQVNAQKLDTFLVTSSDDDFKAHLDEHIDVNSICDYILFNFYVNNCDAFKAKNTNYLTYDGNRWYIIGYDFDATLGNSWQAGQIISADDRSAIDQNGINLLTRVMKLMPDKILERLNYLEENNALDVPAFTRLVDQKANQIGEGVYQLDMAKWGGDPNYTTDISIDDIKAMLVTRKVLLHQYVESLQPK
ncbi:CotH kinase family protein [Lactiplantibacillus plantarum]|uniref:CotH kinase family protein n=1 Tax=Lactiplantibacillus plantarum TaxID=1590 RepID=UPI00227B1AEC|nr:CotH kinase family protein [Lactiplantibacillus plantarum]WAI58928.1 CotH kinase family protein [Lactiplantibacillus plantarum]